MESNAPSTIPTATDVPKGAKCPKCGGAPIRVNHEGPGTRHCTGCRRTIPQTEQGILHCNKKRCYYDLCRRCEDLRFSEGRLDPARREPVDECIEGGPTRSMSLLKMISDYPADFVQNIRELQATVVDSATAKAALASCFGGSSCGFLLAFGPSFQMGRKGFFPLLQALIQFLTAVCTRLKDPRDVLYPFPKGCAGCFVLNLVCAAACYPGVADDVEECFRTICGDRHAKVVERGEVAAMAKVFRDTYSRKEDPFPYMGNCIDFPHSANVAVATGNLLFATKIRTLLRNDEQRGIGLKSVG
jgi:hypothetical protein